MAVIPQVDPPGKPDLDAHPEKSMRRISKQTLLTLGGAVLLGVLGDGVWDLVAKPGLSRLGESTYQLLANISTRLKDAPYESASLDPTPLPALVLFMLVASLPLFVASFLLGERMGSLRLRRSGGLSRSAKKFQKSVNAIKQDVENGGMSRIEGRRQLRDVLRKEELLYRRRRFLILMLFLTLFGVAGWLSWSLVNKAVLIRRVFTSNVTIVAPFLSDVEEEAIWSRFASMRTEQDYQLLDVEIRRVATRNRVKVRLANGTWVNVRK